MTGHVIAGVVFDLDGTLTRPGAIDFAAMRRRIGMEERGSVLHWIERHASDAAEREEMHRIVVEVEDEALAGMELADGLDEVLESLRARRGELVAGISTRTSAEALLRFGELLEACGHGAIGDHFQALVARGHRSPFLGRELAHKPSPEPAHECVRVWDLVGRFPLVTQADAEPATHPELLFVGTTSTIVGAAGARASRPRCSRSVERAASRGTPRRVGAWRAWSRSRAGWPRAAEGGAARPSGPLIPPRAC